MTTILYEHPLNERIRNYLKLEQLFQQANDCQQFELNVAYNALFNALFTIIDTLERNDIRGDLIKELEKLEQNMAHWAKLPDVDTDALQQNWQQTTQLISQLKPNTPQWYQLKEHKMLTSLKQRFAIQGGSSIFDLPQLHFWLNLPKQQSATDVAQWLSSLDQIKQSVDLILKFIRLKNDFEAIHTDSGFYQDSGEGVLLLRIKLDKQANYYPTISGNRFRYSIRFMLPCEQNGRRYSNQATNFQLARC
jgi:cell division protein ZapD